MKIILAEIFVILQLESNWGIPKLKKYDLFIISEDLKILSLLEEMKDYIHEQFYLHKANIGKYNIYIYISLL